MYLRTDLLLTIFLNSYYDVLLDGKTIQKASFVNEKEIKFYFSCDKNICNFEVRTFYEDYFPFKISNIVLKRHNDQIKEKPQNLQ